VEEEEEEEEEEEAEERRCCNYSLVELLMMGECFTRNM
jgi:hypothetical protein